MNKQAVLSLSGGMDSSTVLLHLLADGYDVTAVSFDYGQKHRIELERAQELVDHTNGQCIVDEASKTVEYPHSVKYQVIKLDGLASLLDSNLVEGGDEVPEGHYKEDNMKDTVVPNRNKICSSIIQAIALSIANTKQCKVEVAMGIHAGDHDVYPDCRQEFRDADEKAFRLGNWDSENVHYFTPFLDKNKCDILNQGQALCKSLGLDFQTVYQHTFTSYKPIVHKGKVYSDYKSSSSVERIEAFIQLGIEDPIPYADNTSPVTWNTAYTHVKETYIHDDEKSLVFSSS